MHHGLVNLHFLDEPLQNLPLRDIVVLNIFVEFLAQRQILVLHLLVGFPTRVLRHPVLNHAGLVARRQVNELVDVFVHVVLDPFIVLHIHGLALQVGAMNGALVHVHALQVVHDDGADALHNAVGLREFQVLQRDFQGFDKIAQINGILAVLVQKHVQVELRVVGDVVRVVVGDAIANTTRSRQSERQRAVIGHFVLDCIHQYLVLVYHVLVLRYDVLVVRHQILHHFNQIRKLLVRRLRLMLMLLLQLLQLLRMCPFVDAETRPKFIHFATQLARIALVATCANVNSIDFVFMFYSVNVPIIITIVSA